MPTHDTGPDGVLTPAAIWQILGLHPGLLTSEKGERIAEAQHQATLEWAKGQVAAAQNPFAEYTEQHTLFENAIQKVLENFIRKRLGDLREKDA